MKAVTVTPGVADSVELSEVETPPGPGEGLLVRTLAVGVCGTDREIIAGGHGEPPRGGKQLVLGHESLGVVETVPAASGFAEGDRVVGIVRRPDPVPCACCARGDWDICSNGLYTERGIKGLDGFAAERFFLEPAFAVKVDPTLGTSGVLVEPASILAKAWRRIDAICGIACHVPEKALVIGAGPIGLLGALFAVQRGLEVHVLDRVTAGPKPDLVESLGATYHSGGMSAACSGADVTLECTGVGALVIDAMTSSGSNGIVCLTGVSTAGVDVTVDTGALNRDLVLQNDVVFGSVNANRSDYERAARDLEAADPDWLSALITRQVPVSSWEEAYARRDGDVKAVLVF